MTTDEILTRLDRVKRGGDDGRWTAACPAHEDRENSLSIAAGTDGRTLLRCFSGCTVAAIVAALRLRMADLFQNGHAAGAARPGRSSRGVTLQELASAKGLPAAFLAEHGVLEQSWGLQITYRHRDGSLATRQRRRTAVAAKDGSLWAPGEGSPIAYGCWRLDDAVDKGELLLVEGETDALTAWSHNIPALGIPGADMVKVLTADDLAGIGLLYVVQEPDQGGATFVAGVARRTHELGWPGEARVLQLPVKDLNELHQVAGVRFAEQFAAAKAATRPLEVVPASAPPVADDGAPRLLGEGAGQFLAREFPVQEPYVEGLLSADGGGWIAGEEKVGKTYYALEEALCLALGLPVCGRFLVPMRRRVLFLEEEDPPRRTHVRLRALLRGHELDPDDEKLHAELDAWFRIAVWDGFTFQDPAMVARLEATISEGQPAVVYIDVLRKVTTADLNKAPEASAVLAILDGLRRRHGVVFRMLHHYRKVQGSFRAGRGSQEIGGSFVLGAWAENSLFFEPIGRKQGAVKVEIQSKDGTTPAFRMTFETEGPRYAPTLVRLKAEDDSSAVDDVDEFVYQAIASLPKTEALLGKSGVLRTAVIAALKKSDKTIRRAIGRLEDAGRILVVGNATKRAALYAVKDE